MRAYAIVVALLAGSTSAATVPIGAPLPNFNKGEPLVGLGPPVDAGLLSSIVRDPSPTTSERRFWYAGLLRGKGAESSPIIGSLLLEDTQTNPAGFVTEEINVLKPPAGSIYGSDAVHGSLLIVGSNKKVDDDRFHTVISVYDNLNFGGASIRLRTEYEYPNAYAASSEGLDLRAAGPRPGDRARFDPEELFQQYLQMIFGGTGDCPDVRINQFSVRRSGTESPNILVEDDLPLYEGWCHQRYARGARFVDPGSGEEAFFWGVRCREFYDGPEAACLYKVLPGRPEDGLSLALDRTWGGGDGRVMLKTANGEDFHFSDITALLDGSVVVAAGIGKATTGYLPILSKLDKAGLGDKTFGTNGVWPIPATGGNTQVRSLTSGFGGGIQATGETYTPAGVRPWSFFLEPGTATPKYTEYNFKGHPNSAFFRHIREPDGTLTAVGTWYPNYPDTSGQQPLIARIAGPSLAVEAVQYFHAGFGHYFLTPARTSRPSSIPASSKAGSAPASPSTFIHRAQRVPTTSIASSAPASATKSSHFFTNQYAQRSNRHAQPGLAIRRDCGRGAAAGRERRVPGGCGSGLSGVQQRHGRCAQPLAYDEPGQAGGVALHGLRCRRV